MHFYAVSGTLLIFLKDVMYMYVLHTVLSHIHMLVCYICIIKKKIKHLDEKLL